MEQKEYYIHDFIEDYPDQEDEDIQWKISCRQEFLELQGKRSEKIPKKGEFYKHQKMFLRYMVPYDKLFLIHGTGTGKTGSIINMTEYYRRNEPGRFKKVFVLEPGPPTVNDFQEQIVKLSSDDYYKKRIGNMEVEDKIFKNNVTRLIKKNYNVTTYQKFFKDNLTVSEINEYYDNSIFFLDEAHKLRNLSDTSGSELTQDQKDQIYNYIWKILHVAKGIKVIVATATPMINTARDFVPLLNLLLPEDEQFPYMDDSNLSFYDNINLEQLEPFLRGKVSYVRFLDTGIQIKNRGFTPRDYIHKLKFPDEKSDKKLIPIKKEIVNDEVIVSKGYKKYELPENQPVNNKKEKKIESKITVYPVKMSPTGVQLKTYLEVEASKEIDSFSKNKRQSSVFVFPDGSYGSSGFRKYIEKDEFDNYQFKSFVKGSNSLKAYLNPEDMESTLNNILELSCKFHDYIKREYENSQNERPGNSFCYLELVEGSGVVLLSLILQALGFENFTSNDMSIVNAKTNLIRDSYQKKKRFALITGKTNNLKNILKVFNSPSNLDGEYIQMIIASEVARDGINIENVVRGYVMSAGWHESGMHQALSRFIRATSHVNLKNRNLLELEQEGKNTASYRVNVDIYRMAAFKPNEKIGNPETHSIDLKNYLSAEEKDIKIKRIFRYMKQVSYDAYLNYRRNIRDNDIAYTKETDYQEKYMQIWKSHGKPNNKSRKGLALNQGPNPSDYIYNTFNILYSREYEKEIENNISYIIYFNQIVNIKKLIAALVKEDKKIDYFSVYNTIIRMVDSKQEIQDPNKINNFNISLRGDNLYLSEINYYNTENLSTELNIPFHTSDTLEEIEDKENLLIEIYETLKGKSEEDIINFYMAIQPYTQFKLLLEDSLIRLKKRKTNEINKKILKLFSNYYLRIKKPEGYLEAAKKALTDTSEKKQGRNRAEGSTAGFKNLNLAKVKPKETDEEIYIHFYRESDKTGFNITSILEGKTRKVRILEGNDFRDTNTVENFVYTFIFDRYYDKLLEKYKKSKYYGSYIYRGGEQIEDLVKRRREFFRIVDTENVRNKGRVCVNNTATEVQKVLKYIDDKKEYTKYYTGKINKNDICRIIKTLFEKKGLLFVSL